MTRAESGDSTRESDIEHDAAMGGVFPDSDRDQLVSSVADVLLMVLVIAGAAALFAGVVYVAWLATGRDLLRAFTVGLIVAIPAERLWWKAHAAWPWWGSDRETDPPWIALIGGELAWAALVIWVAATFGVGVPLLAVAASIPLPLWLLLRRSEQRNARMDVAVREAVGQLSVPPGWKIIQPFPDRDTRRWSIWTRPPGGSSDQTLRGHGATALDAVADLAGKLDDESRSNPDPPSSRSR